MPPLIDLKEGLASDEKCKCVGASAALMVLMDDVTWEASGRLGTHSALTLPLLLFVSQLLKIAMPLTTIYPKY